MRLDIKIHFPTDGDGAERTVAFLLIEILNRVKDIGRAQELLISDLDVRRGVDEGMDRPR